MTNNQHTGAAAEQIARQFLEAQGLTFVAQNYHCPQGELDLIFKSPTHLIIVEIKSRKNTAFGTPAEWVTRRKQHKIILATHHYMATHKLPPNTTIRFDVLTMLQLDTHSIEWLTNAFFAE